MEDKINPEVLQQMMFSPSNGESSGGITIEEKMAEDEAKRLITISSKDVSERIGKYKEDMIAAAKKNPAKFEVETERGWMNLKEAIAQGWNPKTGKFDLDPIPDKRREILSELPDNERAQLERMIDPRNLELTPTQAEEYGVDPTSIMMRGQGQPPMPEIQEIDPAMLEALGGGM